jgi:DNA-binding MarR family transcriptional regulator
MPTSHPSMPTTLVDPAQVEAMRFFITTIRFGEALGAAYRERVEDPELARNLPVLTLMSLEVSGPLRPSEISAITRLTPGGTTKLLERLERAGLITRAFGEVPDDRRGVVVHMTDQGRHHVAMLVDGLVTHAPTIEQLVAEMQTFLAELHRLRSVAGE